MVEGYPNDKSQLAEARWITPLYFSAMNIPLVAGRFFSDEDYSRKARVDYQPELCQEIFSHRSPLADASAHTSPDLVDTIVGVIGDVRHTSLEEAPVPQIYHANADFQSGYIAVRSTLPPRAVASAIGAALHTIDPKLAAGGIKPWVPESKASASRRFQTSLLTVFAAIALFLALVGLYGLMAYSVNRRTREVGIRMAGRAADPGRDAAYPQEGRDPACWAWSRSCCLVVCHAGRSGISLWCRPARPNYYPVRLCFAHGLWLDRCLYSRSSRSPSRRSHASVVFERSRENAGGEMKNRRTVCRR